MRQRPGTSAPGVPAPRACQRAHERAHVRERVCVPRRIPVCGSRRMRRACVPATRDAAWYVRPRSVGSCLAPGAGSLPLSWPRVITSLRFWIAPRCPGDAEGIGFWAQFVLTRLRVGSVASHERTRTRPPERRDGTQGDPPGSALRAARGAMWRPFVSPSRAISQFWHSARIPTTVRGMRRRWAGGSLNATSARGSASRSRAACCPLPCSICWVPAETAHT